MIVHYSPLPDYSEALRAAHMRSLVHGKEWKYGHCPHCWRPLRLGFVVWRVSGERVHRKCISALVYRTEFL